MENSCPPCHHIVFLKIWDPLLLLLILLLLLCSALVLSQASIQFGGSRSKLWGPRWELGRGRGGLTKVSSINLAVRVR